MWWRVSLCVCPVSGHASLSNPELDRIAFLPSSGCATASRRMRAVLDAWLKAQLPPGGSDEPPHESAAFSRQSNRLSLCDIVRLPAADGRDHAWISSILEGNRPSTGITQPKPGTVLRNRRTAQSPHPTCYIDINGGASDDDAIHVSNHRDT